jgi:hypothetical protein
MNVFRVSVLAEVAHIPAGFNDENDLFARVVSRSKKMQRDVRFIAHHPTVMTGRSGWNIKEHSGP